MRYVPLIYFFLCIASGFASFFICLLLYIKYKLKEIKNYLFFFLSISLIIIIIMFNFYYKSIFLHSGTKIYDFIFFNFLLICDCLFIFTLSVFIYSLVNKYLIKKYLLLLISFSPIGLNIILYIINYFFKFKYNPPKISLIYVNVLIVLCIFHAFSWILYHLKDINEKLKKCVLKIILIFFILYSPFAFVDSFYDFFYEYIFKYLPDGFSFSAPYYFIWNILILIFSGKYLLKPVVINRDILSNNKISKYNITEREKEIIKCIIKGATNQEISDELFISLTTVKKHIYNIFQKTNVKNRIELINILKEKN